MGGPTKRTAKKAIARKTAAPRKATESEVEKALALQQRVNDLTTLDEATAIEDLTTELGKTMQQVIVQRAIVKRLVRHILTIDPDSKIAKQALAEMERQQAKANSSEED